MIRPPLRFYEGQSYALDTTVADWCTKNCRFDADSSTQGFFTYDKDKFTVEMLGDFGDPEVNLMATMCSAQSFKSQCGLFGLSYLWTHNPMATMIVLPTQPEANFFGEGRLKETVQRCEPLNRMLADVRLPITASVFRFAGINVLLAGSNSDSLLSGKPRGILWGDELKDMDLKSLEKALTRQESYSWNWKALLTSTPNNYGDTAHVAYERGDQRLYYCCCDKCGAQFPLRIFKPDDEVKGGLQWDRHTSIDVEDRSIRYECHNPKCDRVWYDTTNDRKILTSNPGCTWIPTALNQPRNFRSRHYNALLPSWRSWLKIKHRWQSAQQAYKAGNPVGKREFYIEVVGLPYQINADAQQTKILKDSYSFRDYEKGELIPNEDRRYLTIDCQQDRYVVMVTAINTAKRLHVIYWNDQVKGHETVRDLQNRYKVADGLCLMDIRWNTTNFKEICAKYGWTGIMGDARSEWQHPVFQENKQIGTTKRYISSFELTSTPSGNCRWFYYGNSPIKDMVFSIIGRREIGPDGKEFNPLIAFPSDATSELFDQINSEVKQTVVDGDTGKTTEMYVKRKSHIDNHALDNLCQAVALAYGQRLIGQ